MNKLYLALLLIFLVGSYGTFAADSLSVLSNASNQKYLVIGPRAGLGNRLGAMASAYAVAKLTNRTLVLAWKNLSRNHLGEGEMPAEFEALFENKIVRFQELVDDRKGEYISEDLVAYFDKRTGRTRITCCESLCLLLGRQTLPGADHISHQNNLTKKPSAVGKAF